MTRRTRLSEAERTLLVSTLVYHWRSDSNDKGCGCGWQELGRSHPEHVVSVFEQALALERP